MTGLKSDNELWLTLDLSLGFPHLQAKSITLLWLKYALRMNTTYVCMSLHTSSGSCIVIVETICFMNEAWHMLDREKWQFELD